MQVLNDKTAHVGGLLGHCVVCTARLPLRLPRQGELPSHWLCAQCGTRYLALLQEDCPNELLGNVRRADGEQTGDSDSSRSLAAALVTERYAPRGSAKTALPSRSGVVCPWQNSVTRRLDNEIADGSELQVRAEGPAFSTSLVKPVNVGFDAQVTQRFADCFERSSALLEDFFQATQAGRLTDLAPIETVAQQGLQRAAEDLDLLALLGIGVPAGAGISRHGVHVTMVALSIGVQLGLGTRNLLDLGIGCLVHDLGMLRVQGVDVLNGRVLGNSDFREVVKHPLYTFELLRQNVDQLSVASRMVIYQMHERLNGSGYPRGRTASQIHDLAKVAAVADVFVALMSDRPHRPGLIPYYALEGVLRGVRDGFYDSQVARALLKTVSLFPLGSSVQLSDGRKATVIRSNGDLYARPVVFVRNQAEPSGAGTIIDLSKDTQLDVRVALPGQDAQAPG